MFKLIVRETLSLYSIIVLISLLVSLAQTAGSVRQGGPCVLDTDCYSGVCWDRVCSVDSFSPGKTGGGGHCRTHYHCFSNYCLNQLCAKDSPVQGKVGNEGPCQYDSQCYGDRCINGQCREGTFGLLTQLGPGGLCTYNSQCQSSLCLNGICAQSGMSEALIAGSTCFSIENEVARSCTKT